MAKAKKATTIAAQVTLVALDFDEEICTKPAIDDFSRKSLKIAVAIGEALN